MNSNNNSFANGQSGYNSSNARNMSGGRIGNQASYGNNATEDGNYQSRGKHTAADGNQISSTGGYTPNPSSTFQMAGNEQIQGYNQHNFNQTTGSTTQANGQNQNKFKIQYVAVNPNNDKYQLENEESRIHRDNLKDLQQREREKELRQQQFQDDKKDTRAAQNQYYQNYKDDKQELSDDGGARGTSQSQLKNNQAGTTFQSDNKNQTGSHSKGATATSQVAKTTAAPSGNQKMSALDRLKQVQNIFKQTWSGISTEFTGRPGTCTICNKKRHFVKPEQLSEEEERSERFERIYSFLHNIENDNIPLLLSSGQDRQSRTAQNFFNKNRQFDVAQAPLFQYTQSNQNKVKGGVNENVDFKNIDKSQLLMNAPPTSTYGHHAGKQGGYHIDNCELLYKILKGDTKLVRSLCEANGFTYTESHEWNLLWASSSCKAYLYEGLNEFQRINHFPHSYEITRKDRMCFNYVKMQEKFGRDAFDFVPDTYILPNEYGDLLSHYQRLKQTDPRRNVWIVKPSNSSRGRGIHIIDDINDLNVDELSIISRYVTNPLLINGYKFDLRIYVVVTCYEPLRIYVYKEGLARFASETYTAKFNKNNKYMHLTNYSINKKNDNFVQNENSEHDDFGFKWSLSAFCKHLETVGINMSLLWSRIFDVMIKTLACGEHYVLQAMKKNQQHRQNCFEVFGFDILLDSDLKPWLVEVNLSPSLSSDSPLDHTIKSSLLCDTFNMIQVKRFDRKKESLNKIKYRSKGNPSMPGGGSSTGGKHKSYKQDTSFSGQIQIPPTGANDIMVSGYHINPQLNQILEKVVEDYNDEFGALDEGIRKSSMLKFRDILYETVQEYNRCGEFVRIFPCKGSKQYEKYFSGVFGTRMLNRIVHKVLFSNEICPYDKNLRQLTSDDPNQKKITDPKNLKYDIEGLPQEQSYDHYKKVLQKQKSKEKGQKLATINGRNKQSRESLNDSDNDEAPKNSSQTHPRQYEEEKQPSASKMRSASHNNQTNTSNLNNSSNKNSSTLANTKKIQSSSSTTPNNQRGEKAGFQKERSPVKRRQDEQANTQNSSTLGSNVARQNAHENNNQASTRAGDTSTNASASGSQSGPANGQQKIMITGDDILIEYVTRLMKTFSTNTIKEEDLTNEQQQKIEKFITHYVWYAQDKSNADKKGTTPQTSQGSLKIRLENRLNEMLERRRRLLKMLFKNEGRLNMFHDQYPDIVKRKKEVIEKFDSKELEHLLSNSTKNVAQEVVGCLIPAKGKGILNEIENQTLKR